MRKPDATDTSVRLLRAWLVVCALTPAALLLLDAARALFGGH